VSEQKAGTEEVEFEQLEKFYRISTVAEIFDVKPRTIHSWIKQGKMIGEKINGRWRVAESEIRRQGNMRHGA
jgi:predicted site-specific integrase-resolvase